MALRQIAHGEPFAQAWLVRRQGQALGYVIITLGFSVECGGRDGFIDDFYLVPAAQHEAAGVKQQLAAVRMLSDWLIIGQVLPMNPAAAMRGPTHVVKTGSTPVLDAAEWRKLLDSISTETIRDLRDGRFASRAITSTAESRVSK